MGEALESATNAVAAVQNMSDRIKTIPNGPAPDDDAELCRLFTFVYNNNFLSQLKNSNLDVLGRAWILFRKQSFAYRPQEVLRPSGPELLLACVTFQTSELFLKILHNFYVRVCFRSLLGFFLENWILNFFSCHLTAL